MSLITKDQAVARYGAIVNGRWANKSLWMTNLTVPAGISLKYAGVPVHHIPCNKDMVGPLMQAFQNLIDRHDAAELQSYGGCFNIRSVRGSSAANWSWHSYGMAIDVNPEKNPMGVHSHNMTPKFVECFTSAGFFWGGNYHGRPDEMHFQLGAG